MSNEMENARIEYLENQIKICREDISMVEQYNEDPIGPFYDSSIDIWSKLNVKLKRFQEELEILKGDAER